MNTPVTATPPSQSPTPSTTMQPASPTTTSRLPGVKVLLEGPTGTGKTYAYGTLVDLGIETFYMCFESAEALLGYWTDRGLPVPPNLHVHQVKPSNASFLEQADAVKQVNTLSYETLKKVIDPNRAKYNQLEEFLRNFNDVRDDHTGKKYGAVDTWGPDRVLIIDHFTGLCDATMKAVIGGKADRDQKDWGLAQNLVENLIRKLAQDCRCHFMMSAHIERETDMVLGGTKITVSALGRALAPKIPPMFSDVILTVRNGREFYWDTENPQADLKTRNLPIAAKNEPTFKTIFDKWKSRGGVFAS